jgi:hypothetical protein
MASGANVPSIFCLFNYAYKCHYLPNNNNIYKFSHNYKYDGTRRSNNIFCLNLIHTQFILLFRMTKPYFFYETRPHGVKKIVTQHLGNDKLVE